MKFGKLRVGCLGQGVAQEDGPIDEPKTVADVRQSPLKLPEGWVAGNWAAKQTLVNVSATVAVKRLAPCRLKWGAACWMYHSCLEDVEKGSSVTLFACRML